MSLTTLAWLCMAAYAMHILEEYALDWRNWAHNVLGLPVEWNDFYVTNGVVVALGIAQAMLAPTLPLAVLGYAGLQFINAVLMHVTPFLRTRGRFSPGLFTAVFLFLPLSLTTFWTAWVSGLASIAEIGLGLAIGALTLAFPIVMLKVKSWPYFRQDIPA
ncbi:HXXEE domain-containing protein [Roseomonas sp. CAU 1739]|uniref:HXXEE domain-containing protein n=1 Tax=Roseomonas sp. CAU 1739 TaxID=3140364 RepID=UPI00325C31CF